MEFSNLKPRDQLFYLYAHKKLSKKVWIKQKEELREKKAKIKAEKKAELATRQIKTQVIPSLEKLTGGFIKIEVKDNNVEQAIRVPKKLQKMVFLK